MSIPELDSVEEKTQIIPIKPNRPSQSPVAKVDQLEQLAMSLCKKVDEIEVKHVLC